MTTTEMLVGMRERISVVEETSYGSGGDMAANGEVIGYDATIEVGFENSYQEILSAGADSRAPSDYVAAADLNPFTLSFIPYSWKWIKYLFNVADAGSDPYTHTFTEAGTVNSFKLEWAKRATTNHVITLTGCVIKSARIVYSKGAGEGKEGLIRVVAECVAKDKSQGSSVSTLAAGNPTATPFKYSDIKVTLEGSEIIEVNNGEIMISNTIDEKDGLYCNSTAGDKISNAIPKKLDIKFKSNVNVADKTYYDMYVSRDELTSTNKLEIIRDTNDDIVFTFSKIFVTKGVANTNLEGVLNVDLEANVTSFSSCVATDSIETY